MTIQEIKEELKKECCSLWTCPTSGEKEEQCSECGFIDQAFKKVAEAIRYAAEENIRDNWVREWLLKSLLGGKG